MSPAEAIERLFERPPVAWWIYVGCDYCNAPRKELCQSTFGPARAPHASRVREGLALHSTIWLLTYQDGKFASDVLGDNA